jgi:RNA polymerase sigma factor (sigma-70 family)
MRIPDIDKAALLGAQNGDLAAIDAVLVGIQPAVYNLAVRMLGNRDDARDACQEILLKVVTHLGNFRHEAAFSTWVYQIANNHLLTAATRARELPEVSLDALAEKLSLGLAYGLDHGDGALLTPEDKAIAREIAVGCTQGMLMCLPRDLRLAYLLDIVFGLSSEQAAQVLAIESAAYRKRLSRAREQLHKFFTNTCGLVNPNAACRCERQLPAAKVQRSAGQFKPMLIERREHAQAEQALGKLMQMGDAAAVLRAHPNYRAPDAMIAAIRSVLHSETFR